MNRPALSRRGVSLVELLVVVTTSTVVLSLVTVVLTTLFRQDKLGQRGRVQHLVAARLADQFRADVRRATHVGAEADGKEQRVELQLADGRTVVYRSGQRQLVRSEDGPNGEPRREVFVLPKRATIAVRESDAGAATIVTLMLEYPLGREVESKRRRLPIAAALGRDLRWARGAEGKPVEE